MPMPCSSAASLRRLLQVRRKGDSGSPRVTGSTSRSGSRNNFRSWLTVVLRPPPDVEYDSEDALPVPSIRDIPRRMAALDIPVA